MASVKELKQAIEKAIIDFSKENEIDNMNVHVTIEKKVKCNMVGQGKLVGSRNRNKYKVI